LEKRDRIKRGTRERNKRVGRREGEGERGQRMKKRTKEKIREDR
jgi:hypothetical protein